MGFPPPLVHCCNVIALALRTLVDFDTPRPPSRDTCSLHGVIHNVYWQQKIWLLERFSCMAKQSIFPACMVLHDTTRQSILNLGFSRSLEAYDVRL